MERRCCAGSPAITVCFTPAACGPSPPSPPPPEPKTITRGYELATQPNSTRLPPLPTLPRTGEEPPPRRSSRRQQAGLAPEGVGVAEQVPLPGLSGGHVEPVGQDRVHEVGLSEVVGTREHLRQLGVAENRRLGEAVDPGAPEPRQRSWISAHRRLLCLGQALGQVPLHRLVDVHLEPVLQPLAAHLRWGVQVRLGRCPLRRLPSLGLDEGRLPRSLDEALLPHRVELLLDL